MRDNLMSNILTKVVALRPIIPSVDTMKGVKCRRFSRNMSRSFFLCLIMRHQYFERVVNDLGLGIEVSDSDIHPDMGYLSK